MKSRRSFLPVLTTALIALLVFAASAAAEVRSGEASSDASQTSPGGIDLLKVAASYDSSSGATSFKVTTRESPTAPANAELFIGLLTVKGACDGSVFAPGQSIAPGLIVQTPYTAPTDPSEPDAEYSFYESEPAEMKPPALSGPASKAIDGTTTTLGVSVSQIANRPFNCVVAETRAGNEPGEQDFVVFPIVAQPEAQPTPPSPAPSPPVQVQTITKTVSPPAPAPAALSLPRIKPVSAGTEKWKKVKLAVTNTGGTAAGPVTLKVKAPRGVMVKPATLRLPALLPGQTWTLPVLVKATEEAKKVSAVTLTATLPGITATSSFAVRANT